MSETDEKEKIMVTVKIHMLAHDTLKLHGEKGKTHSETIMRLANNTEKQDKWIPKIKYVAERTEQEIEDAKKRGSMSLSIADELLTLLKEFFTELEGE